MTSDLNGEISSTQGMIKSVTPNFVVNVFCHCDYEPFYVASRTLFWDDITKFWDENLSSFTFSTGKLRKTMFWTNKN